MSNGIETLDDFLNHKSNNRKDRKKGRKKRKSGNR